MGGLMDGLTALGNGTDIAYLVAGSLIGMIVGVIPGLSTVVILSVLLIFVQDIDVTATLCLFIGAQSGSFYSASVSAILLNTPGHPEAYPITLDGYPMARNGQPGRALGLSACSTLIGGLIGCAILVGFLPILDKLPTAFHPPDYVALVTLAILLVGTLGTDSIIKAVVAAGAGLMLAAVGPSAITGTFRYTFGSTNLYSGISLVAVALGVFAIPQMVMLFGTGTATADLDKAGRSADASNFGHEGYFRSVMGGVLETFRYWRTLLQSGVVGGLTGMIPGIGGFTGNFLAYGLEKQTSRRRKLFGTGVPEGIIAPEGSSLAKEAGHIVPIVGLGIPGGVAGALFIGALAIKDMKVGYGFQSAYPSVTQQMVWITALSGLIGTVAGVLVGPQIARITRVPGPLIVPFIFAICVSGAYITDGQFFAVVEMAVFGIIGFGLRRLGYPLGGLILGLVLGPTFENNVYLTHNVYPDFSWVKARPLADVIFLLCIVVVVAKIFEMRGESRQRKTALAAQLAETGDPVRRRQIAREQERSRTPHPLLSLILTTGMLVVSLFFLVYGLANYDFATGVMPEIGAFVVALPSAIMLPFEVRRYVRYRREAGLAPSAGGVAGPAPVSANRSEAARLLTRLGGASPAAVEATVETTMAAAGTLVVEDEETDGLPPIKAASFGPNGQYRRETIALLCLWAVTALCWLVGFTIGIVAFVALYGLFATGRNLRTRRSRVIFAVIAAVVMGLVTVALFTLSSVTLFEPKIGV